MTLVTATGDFIDAAITGFALGVGAAIRSAVRATRLGVGVVGQLGTLIPKRRANDIGNVCWLRASGKVSCLSTDFANPEAMDMVFANEYFTDMRALAIVVNGYSSQRDLCVVRDDASIWCIGGNSSGKFGSGDMQALEIETQVQPPGSVHVNCSQLGHREVRG